MRLPNLIKPCVRLTHFISVVVGWLSSDDIGFDRMSVPDLGIQQRGRWARFQYNNYSWNVCFGMYATVFRRRNTINDGDQDGAAYLKSSVLVQLWASVALLSVYSCVLGCRRAVVGYSQRKSFSSPDSDFNCLPRSAKTFLWRKPDTDTGDSLQKR